jgi:hypothetical protein
MVFLEVVAVGSGILAYLYKLDRRIQGLEKADLEQKYLIFERLNDLMDAIQNHTH